MKKRITAITLAAASMATLLASCGGSKVPDTEETLEIYALDAGYGVEWLTDMLDLFKEQDWVKEKYPNLIIANPTVNDVTSYATTRLEAGEGSNTYDLMFSSILSSFEGKNSDGEETLVDLTEVVYGSEVPNEGVLFKDKINASYIESLAYNNPNDPETNGHLYSTPWAGGFMGFVYNEDILNDLGIAVPRTTDELYKACETIMSLKGNTEGKYNLGYSFIQSKDANYWDSLYGVWYAQYQGVKGFYNFYNGIDGNRLSKNIFKQKGRLESLKVFEELLDYDLGFLNPSSFTYEFMTAQTMFLQGNGVFHVNGDWFPSEMAEMEERIPEEDRYTFKMMRTPIVSSIIETTPSIPDDATLSKVIEAIDNEQDSYGDVTATDFAKIKEARSVIYSIGPNHKSIIPSYANGKEVAIDFLRFMATDIALDCYMNATMGASLPFTYNVKGENETLFNSLCVLHQERLEYFNSAYNPVKVLPMSGAFPLARYGGVAVLRASTFFTSFSAAGNTKTAQSYYDDTLAYWTDEQWSSALSKAGLQ